MKKFISALKKINSNGEKILKKAGKIYQIKIKNNFLYIQISGIGVEEAKKVLQVSCVHAKVPEPLRVAHIIASGIYYGG